MKAKTLVGLGLLGGVLYLFRKVFKFAFWVGVFVLLAWLSGLL